MASSFTTGFDVLRQRNFALILTARLISTLALQMQSVAISWQIYELTGSLLNLGWIGLAQFAPFVLLILVAGHAADHYSRRNIIACCYALNVVASLLLFGLTAIGVSVVWPFFAVLALVGCARAFSMPAGQAIVINVVPIESFGQAVAINSSSFHVAMIAGPVAGGMLYVAGPRAVYFVVAALLLVSFALMLLARGASQIKSQPNTSWASLLTGLSFVKTRPVVLGAISLDLFAVLFGGAVALLPAVARDVLHLGTTGLGLLRTAPALGAALTALLLALRPISRHAGWWMFAGVAIFGAATILFGYSTRLAWSMFALSLAGAGDMVSVYVRHLLVQLETPDAIRGRVSAISAVFIGASNELGEFESGLTAEWLGLFRAIVFGGVATLAVTGGWMLMFPSLRRMDRFAKPPEAIVAEPGILELGT